MSSDVISSLLLSRAVKPAQNQALLRRTDELCQDCVDWHIVYQK